MRTAGIAVRIARLSIRTCGTMFGIESWYITVSGAGIEKVNGLYIGNFPGRFYNQEYYVSASGVDDVDEEACALESLKSSTWTPHHKGREPGPKVTVRHHKRSLEGMCGVVGRMWKQRKFTDAEIVCNNRRIPIHWFCPRAWPPSIARILVSTLHWFRWLHWFKLI